MANRWHIDRSDTDRRCLALVAGVLRPCLVTTVWGLTPGSTTLTNEQCNKATALSMAYDEEKSMMMRRPRAVLPDGAAMVYADNRLLGCPSHSYTPLRGILQIRRRGDPLL